MRRSESFCHFDVFRTFLNLHESTYTMVTIGMKNMQNVERKSKKTANHILRPSLVSRVSGPKKIVTCEE